MKITPPGGSETKLYIAADKRTQQSQRQFKNNTHHKNPNGFLNIKNHTHNKIESKD